MIYSLAYLVNLIRDPNIASITPTSGFGIRRVCRHMDFGTAKTVVEYGPATGVFTRYILEHLSADGRCIAIDTNENFLKILRSRIQDPRLSVFNDSAENVSTIVKSCDRDSADYVISGIPFTMLPDSVADNIVKATHTLLRPGGKFLIYQFLKPETKTTKGIHRFLPRHFSDIEREIEWLNVPPLWVYVATKS